MSPIEDDTISDGNPTSADAHTDSYWLFTFWTNSNKDGRRFRHQYPAVYTLCRRVDTTWRAVFNTIDNICSTTTLYVGYTLVSISQLASVLYRKSAAVSLDILSSVYYHDYDVILSKFNLHNRTDICHRFGHFCVNFCAIQTQQEWKISAGVKWSGRALLKS